MYGFLSNYSQGPLLLAEKGFHFRGYTAGESVRLTPVLDATGLRKGLRSIVAHEHPRCEMGSVSGGSLYRDICAMMTEGGQPRMLWSILRDLRSKSA